MERKELKKLKRRLEESKKQRLLHQWTIDHHKNALYELEREFVEIGVKVANAAGLEREGGDEIYVLDDTAEIGYWKCPPDEDEKEWLKETCPSPEEWEVYWARANLNPLGICLYDVKTDRPKDNCVFCGLPDERK